MTNSIQSTIEALAKCSLKIVGDSGKGVPSLRSDFTHRREWGCEEPLLCASPERCHTPRLAGSAEPAEAGSRMPQAVCPEPPPWKSSTHRAIDK